jgi:hypothetical protein
MKRDGFVFYSTRGPEQTRLAEMVDLSPTGVSFVCSQKLAAETVLQISSPDFHATALVKNVCVRRTSGRKAYLVGLKFLTVEFYDSCGSFLSTSA